MSIKIDDDIPSPGKKAVYPTNQLEVGQSFAIPFDFKKMNAITSNYGRYRPKKFIRRTRIEDGVKVYRVWRIE